MMHWKKNSMVGTLLSLPDFEADEIKDMGVRIKYNKHKLYIFEQEMEDADRDGFGHIIRRKIDGTKSKIIIQGAQIIGLF